MYCTVYLMKSNFILTFNVDLYFCYSMANSGLGKMHLDLYTQNAGLTHKAKFWCNYVSALKGEFLYLVII